MRLFWLLIVFLVLLITDLMVPVLKGLGWVLLGLFVIAVVAAFWGALTRKKPEPRSPAEEREARKSEHRELPKPPENSDSA